VDAPNSKLALFKKSKFGKHISPADIQDLVGKSTSVDNNIINPILEVHNKVNTNCLVTISKVNLKSDQREVCFEMEMGNKVDGTDNVQHSATVGSTTEPQPAEQTSEQKKPNELLPK